MKSNEEPGKPNSGSLESDVAIIGLAGRFPGAKNIDDFWRNLRDGVESISFFSNDELESLSTDLGKSDQPNFVAAGAVLQDIDLFDASFFGFNPREAEILDPQHRFFLECSHEALESAGYAPQTYKGRIGVYAGSSSSSYFLNNLNPNPDLVESLGRLQISLGNNRDHLSTLVCYKLNLKGPGVTVQTACSTSLVAVHLACQSVLNGECDIALAGGVSIDIPQKVGYFYKDGGINSPDGHCRAFDADSRGTIKGNGLGVVVLKRLADAIRDGDIIHVIIKGSAINNDGSLKVGYTAPSINGQAEVISEAIALAGVDPETITYIETHGTGTVLGDPIEIAALAQCFRAHTEKEAFCAIGSVKTNIGHLDVAAGVTGLIKTVLALKNRLLPPSLHFKKPNPKIDFGRSPFYVNTNLTEWSKGKAPRRAGVSSFGMGGTNAHAILEEAPPAEASSESRPRQLLVLSAKTSDALERANAQLAEHLKDHPDINLADVAYTCQVGRTAFNHRQMLVCKDREDALNTLETRDPKRIFSTFHEPRFRPVAFMFPGQGAQYVRMGSELYNFEQKFKEQIDTCSELLKPHLGLDLRKILYPNEDQIEEASQQLKQTFITQPALFVVEYALAQLWMELGIRPQAMIGHSIGEYVAACLAGVFSLEGALALVAARSRLMQSLPKGAMLVVPLSEKEVQPLLGEDLSLAAVNGPSLCVISGPTEAVDQLENCISERAPNCRRLHTSHAFHSSMMEPIFGAFTDQMQKVNLSAPKIPYISNLSGTWITSAEATNPDYWVRHLRHTVRFGEGVRELLKEPDRFLLEVGPGQTLSALARQHPDKAAGQLILSSLRHPNEEHSDVEFLLNTLGRLWLAGIEVNWSDFYARERRHRISLPTYPFERQRYWVEPQKQINVLNTRRASSEKKPDVADWFYIPSWKRSVPSELLKRSSQADQECCWMIFSHDCRLSSQLIGRLKQNGQDVTTVMVGEQFTKLDKSTYAINPERREDYQALLEELHKLGQIPQMIVHLWGVTPNDQRLTEEDIFEQSQKLGFYSLLFLAQALGEREIPNTLQICLVSNNMYEVSGSEFLCPEKATILGPCMVIPQEYPNITCRSIDLESSVPQEELIDQLMVELTAITSPSIVAYRGKHRWTQTFEAVRFNNQAETKTRLRERGVYLITGGLGGMGLVLAEHLAQSVQARLVLVGRSAFPESGKWKEWLEVHGDQDETSRKIRKVQELEGLGAEILVMKADVANREQMQNVLARANQRFGEINGVIHSAGVAGGGIIQLKTPEDAEIILAPKVRGALVLDAIFKKVKLDFFVLCSSLSSIGGGFGQVDYCAANAFLDAFAHHHALCDGSPIVSINWDTWQEVGMAVNTKVPADLEEARQLNLKRGISSKEGREVFDRILGSMLPQIVISNRDISVRMDQLIGLESLRDTEPFEKVGSSSLHPRPSLQSTYIEPRNEVERIIVDIWRDLLGIEQLGVYDNFFELGGHSLLATQVMSHIRKALKIDLRLRTLFESPTVAELSETVEKAKRMNPAAQVPAMAPVSRDSYRAWRSDSRVITSPVLDKKESEQL